MLRLRSRRHMLRQAIIMRKTANAIAVANTVIIVANERTYITPYANVRNTLFPWTEKAPAVDGRGKLAERGEKLEFSPIRSASLESRTLLSRLAHGRRLVYLRQRFVR